MTGKVIDYEFGPTADPGAAVWCDFFTCGIVKDACI
jgi:hypothetical protein